MCMPSLKNIIYIEGSSRLGTILSISNTRTMSVAIYNEVIRASYGTAAALATILTVTTIVSLLIFFKGTQGVCLTADHQGDHNDSGTACQHNRGMVKGHQQGPATGM